MAASPAIAIAISHSPAKTIQHPPSDDRRQRSQTAGERARRFRRSRLFRRDFEDGTADLNDLVLAPGLPHAIDRLTEALPPMANFAATRRAQARLSEQALPDILSARDRSGQWSVPVDGPLLLRAYDKVVEIGYRQNRLIVRITREDIRFEQHVAAKMRAAVEALRAACHE